MTENQITKKLNKENIDMTGIVEISRDEVEVIIFDENGKVDFNASEEKADEV